MVQTFSVNRSGLQCLAVLLFCVITLSGCFHSEEHITINSDGSGLVEAHCKFPPGTLKLVDMMFGGMMQAFQSLGQKPGAPPPAPVSVAEQMFGNRDDIEKKIKKSGVNATLESFKTEKKEDGLHVFYTIKTADIIAFSRSQVLVSKLKIMRNDAGDWFCRPIADMKGQKKGQEGQAKLDEFKNSPSFQSMPPAMQETLLSSAMDFRAESQVSFPDAITETTGMFQKKDDKTAIVAVSSEMIMNPQMWEKWAKAKDKTIARTGSGPVPPDFYTPVADEEAAAAAPVTTAAPDTTAASAVTKSDTAAATVAAQPMPAAEPKADSTVKVVLKNGKVAEGTLIEQTQDHVKIDFQGVTLTYYDDEVLEVKK